MEQAVFFRKEEESHYFGFPGLLWLWGTLRSRYPGRLLDFFLPSAFKENKDKDKKKNYDQSENNPSLFVHSSLFLKMSA
jgi:hypothetical protein